MQNRKLQIAAFSALVLALIYYAAPKDIEGAAYFGYEGSYGNNCQTVLALGFNGSFIETRQNGGIGLGGSPNISAAGHGLEGIIRTYQAIVTSLEQCGGSPER